MVCRAASQSDGILNMIAWTPGPTDGHFRGEFHNQETEMTIMQVNLDYEGHRNLFRWVDGIGENAIIWAVIIGVAVVLFVLFITKRRK